MFAIDTNLVVRYLTGDDPRQAARARALIETEDVFVSRTVLLETEWVLRAGYGLATGALAAALRAFAGLPGVTIEDAALAATALDWMAAGMDFADALHLARARGRDAFVSFDRRLARIANSVGAPTVRDP